MELYNSRIIDSYIKLLSNKYPHADVAKILKHADMEPYEVADQSHWFTQRQIDLFYEMAVNRSLKNNPNFFGLPPMGNFLD